MKGYVHGRSADALAHQIRQQQQQLLRIQQAGDAAVNKAAATAAATRTQANTEVSRIIAEAIAAADKIRHDAEQTATATKAAAEHDANRIRERAYLEGRALADTRRIEHDHRMAGNARRKQLERNLR